MNTLLFLFEGLTALDAVGPYEVLSRIPGAALTTVALEAGPLRTDSGALGLEADRTISDLTSEEIANTDILVIPGGPGAVPAGASPVTQAFVRRVHEHTSVTASVCTGALILGQTGLLTGRRATTHWAFLEALREHGATPVSERVVRDERIATAAGVSAGIDLALTLVGELSSAILGQALELGIEYDPQPPFGCGHPSRAPTEVTAMVRAAFETR